jgi:hypothetical protein
MKGARQQHPVHANLLEVRQVGGVTHATTGQQAKVRHGGPHSCEPREIRPPWTPDAGEIEQDHLAYARRGHGEGYCFGGRSAGWPCSSATQGLSGSQVKAEDEAGCEGKQGWQLVPMMQRLETHHRRDFRSFEPLQVGDAPDARIDEQRTTEALVGRELVEQSSLNRGPGDRVEIGHVAPMRANALTIGASERHGIAWPARRERRGHQGIVRALAAHGMHGTAGGEVEHGNHFERHGILVRR